MQTIIAVSMIVIGYLSGSVNYAIVVTRVVAGIEIRTVGNRNPGTANVSRNVGKGWAALVFFLDVFKGLGPMLLAAQVLQPASPVVEHAVLGAVGAAAILGHVSRPFSASGVVAASPPPSASWAILCQSSYCSRWPWALPWPWLSSGTPATPSDSGRLSCP